jgi:hypothetical protein
MLPMAAVIAEDKPPGVATFTLIETCADTIAIICVKTKSNKSFLMKIRCFEINN